MCVCVGCRLIRCIKSSSFLPGLADFSEVKPASEFSEGMLWMDDRGRSVSVLVSQVDSVSLVQLSKYRGSRASVLLPPQPIALHRSAFSSRLGRFPTLPERDGINKADFIHINKLLNPFAALNLAYITSAITRMELTEQKVNPAAIPQGIRPSILFL